MQGKSCTSEGHRELSSLMQHLLLSCGKRLLRVEGEGCKGKELLELTGWRYIKAIVGSFLGVPPHEGTTLQEMAKNDLLEEW